MRWRGTATLFTGLACAGVVAPACAQAADRHDVLEINFQALCQQAGRAARPPLPTGWTLYQPPGRSDAHLRCGPQGMELRNADGQVFLYTTRLSKAGTHALTQGRYLLSGGGVGATIFVRNGFGDFSFEARNRILNLNSEAPIVNQIEFDWDGSHADGLLEWWGAGLQWLRLEKLPATPGLPRTLAVPSAAWTLAPGTTLQAQADGVRLANPSRTGARIEQTFVLPPGRHELRSRARGDVELRLRSGPDDSQRFDLVDESSHSPLDGPAVALSARFTATGQPVTLSLAAPQGGRDGVVYPVEIRPVIEASLTPQQRTAQRPTPWPARGMGVADVFDLLPDTRPPRDRNGAECARLVQAWATHRAWSHQADFVDLRRLGVNLIRLPVPTVSRAIKDDCRLVEAGDITAPGRVAAEAFWARAWPVILAETAAVVQAAGAAGLKVVLQMHPATPTIPLNERPDGWVNLQARRDFVRGWREMATHLSPLRQHVWAYELVNEPHELVAGRGNVVPSQWRHLAIDTVAAIRAAEQAADARREPSWVAYAPVLQPTGHWARQYAPSVLLPDERVIYTEHYYDEFDFTHQNICEKGYPVGSLPYAGSLKAVQAALRPLREFSQVTGAPVYVGEFSAAAWAGWSPGGRGAWQPRTDAAGLPVHDNVLWLRDVLDAMEDNGFAWTHFSFRTYYAWNPELIMANGPCGPFEYQRAGQPDTPTMQLLRAYLQRNLQRNHQASVLQGQP